MSKPLEHRTRHPKPHDEPATEASIPIGSRLLEILDIAYRARRAVLLEGPTGIGKSQIAAAFAAAHGIELIVLDLSLLEPPDLIGLPVIRDGRTHYASPAELPTSGRGILMLEELNRAEIPVMQPALQLLSARRLHAYELPPGWMCIAAVNPEDGDYQVNRLDPALRSRFLQLSVCADRASWLSWAAGNNVHPVVRAIVHEHVDVFDHASPRSWAYASEILHAVNEGELRQPDLVRATLRGYLPSAWAVLLTDALAKLPSTPGLHREALFTPEGPAAVAALVKQLSAANRIDAVTMVASRIRHAFMRELADAVAGGEVGLAHVERLVAALPGDLREQCLETAVESKAGAGLLRELRVVPEEIEHGYVGSPTQGTIQSWLRDGHHHRVRLVAVNVLRHLQQSADAEVIARDAARSRQLEALVIDSGPMAHDLSRWLWSHGASGRPS